MTTPDFFGLLRCPECGHDLAYEPIPQRDDRVGDCGLLHCSCFNYPVLDNIPILTQERLVHRSIADDRVVAGGPLPNDLTGLIANGSALEGLVSLLTFPVCPWPLNRVGALRRLSLRAPHHVLGLAYRKRRIRRMLARRETLTAEDWLAAFYWHAPAPFDPFNYFFFRFAQPRHLATLAMLSVLPPDEAPLIDLACGYGHFLHTVTSGGQSAVGLDQNFHQLWVARHYVAPLAEFVCADAANTLPFGDNVFSAALCADAFQYFSNSSAVLDELARCTNDGPILLAGVANRLVDPAETDALAPNEYAELLERWQWCCLTEEAVLTSYLGQRGPDLRTSSASEALDTSHWLYYIVAKDDELFCDHGPFEKWPHSIGKMSVNPIYVVNGDHMEFQFPSPWFEFENKRMQEYMPLSACLQDNQSTLLAQTVLIGLPERYARATGRPWPVSANRRLQYLGRRPNPS